MFFLLCYINKKLSIFINNNNNVWIKINYIQQTTQNTKCWYILNNLSRGEEIKDIAKIIDTTLK
jgi:hypothetical protein